MYFVVICCIYNILGIVEENKKKENQLSFHIFSITKNCNIKQNNA
jgi:hypothetical protein